MSVRRTPEWWEGWYEAGKQAGTFRAAGIPPAFYNPYPHGTEERDGFAEAVYQLGDWRPALCGTTGIARQDCDCGACSTRRAANGQA